MLPRYLQWEVRDLGLSIKELLEALEGIRIGVVRTDEGRLHVASGVPLLADRNGTV